MDTDKRKILSALSHGAIFFSATIVSVGIPIAILFITADPVIKENAKESLNFHIYIYIYAVIFALLINLLIGISLFVLSGNISLVMLIIAMLIGIPLFVLLGIISLVMPTIAILNIISNPHKPYRYPFIFRLL